MWGMHVENAVEESGEKPDRKIKEMMRKRQSKLESLLSTPGEEPVTQAPKKFRDPAEVMRKQ